VSWLDDIDRHPMRLRSYYDFTSNADASHQLYQGVLTYSDSTGERSDSEGTIHLRWLPFPRIVMELHLPEPRVKWEDEVIVGIPLSGSASQRSIEVPCRLIFASSYGLRSRVQVTASESIVLGNDQASAAWAHVHLVNGFPFRGAGLTEDYAPGSVAVGRFEVANASWRAVIDSDVSLRDQLRASATGSGYVVSHEVRLEAVGRLLTPDLAAQYAQQLVDFLSLVTGCSTGALVITGYDAEDAEVWSCWQAPQVEPYAGLQRSALPQFFFVDGEAMVQSPQMNGASQRYVDLVEGDQSAIVSRLRSWYLALGDSSATNALIFAAAGLELMTYQHLVIHQGLSAGGFDKLTAADRLRLLLADLGASKAVPETLAGLSTLVAQQAKTGGEADGPWAVVDFRNGIAHPPVRKKRTHVEDAELVFEAALLGNWYLDLAVLHYLGYEGPYINRVSSSRLPEHPPWVSGAGTPRIRGGP